MSSSRAAAPCRRGLFAGRRALLGACSAMLAAPRVLAQTAVPKYAVLSLFGNELQIVTRRAAIGSNLSRPAVQSVPVSGGAFDQSALKVAERVLLKADPRQKEVVLLTSTSPSLHSNQSRFFDGDLLRLPDAFTQAMRQDGATHLVLLTRHSGDARFKAVNSWLGEGSVEGLGFYLDRVEVLKNEDTRETRVGYIATYAYVMASLVELSSMRVLRRQQMQGTQALVQSFGDGTDDPWQVLSPAEKMRLIDQLLGQEIERTLPTLIAAR